MSEILRALTQKIISSEYPSFTEMRAGFDAIMDGEASPALLASFLVGLKMRGETPDDIAAGASVLREKATLVEAPDNRTMDIVGTGGDGIGTYNISTAAAFVMAGAGIPMAKHGNKAVSSKSGAADVLSSLGITLDCEYSLLADALNEAGIVFLMAPRHHAAMRHVGPIRAELGMRTIFNLLGPLSNPALVTRILVGVFDKGWCRPFAEALHQLGTTDAWVVHGADGLDELSTTGENHIAVLKDGQVSEMSLHPEEIGLKTARLDDIKGGSPEENADALRRLLAGDTGPYRDIVILNAAGGLVAGGFETDLKTAAERAAGAIDSGKALSCLNKLVEVTGR